MLGLGGVTGVLVDVVIVLGPTLALVLLVFRSRHATGDDHDGPEPEASP
ncbi:MAG: hypothetical protein ABIW46_02700 [Acidimicrobiales bacterium]